MLESIYESDVIFATSRVELLLRVSVIKSGLQEDVQSSTEVVPFYPAVVLEKTEVVLFTTDPVAVVVIHGSAELLASFVVGG